MRPVSIFFSVVISAVLASAGTYALTQTGSAPTPEAQSEAIPSLDQRIAIYLNQDEQFHVRDEMLGFLNGLAEINEGILAEDRELIRQVADRLRVGDGSGRSIRQKAPEGFVQISRALRTDFGSIADTAMDADFDELQALTSSTLYRCSACHGTYRVIPERLRPNVNPTVQE